MVFYVFTQYINVISKDQLMCFIQFQFILISMVLPVGIFKNNGDKEFPCFRPF